MKTIKTLFNESKADKVVKDVMGLSSGTLGTLTGFSKYSDLDKVRRKFNQFVVGVVGSSPNEFKTWQEAWKRFEEVYDIKTLELK